MLNKVVTESSNALHFFPSTTQEQDQSLGEWKTTGRRFICKVKDFFDKGLLQKASEELCEMEFEPNTLVGNRNIFRVPLIGDIEKYGLISPIVEFDSNCKLQNSEELKKCLEQRKATEAVTELTCSSLEKMAKMGRWSKEKIPVNSFFLRYRLDEENKEVTNLQWHRDLNSLSMTAVISPCKQKEGEYSGGKLLFGERTKDPSAYFSFGGGHIETTLFNTVKELSYPDHGCFFFDNLWSQHKVTDIRLTTGKSCERILFSIFANPNPDQYNSFVDNNSDFNLV